MEAHENEPSRPTKKKHEQGWIQGVLIRNLVQIWGLMLFLRVAWVVCTTGLSNITLYFLHYHEWKLKLKKKQFQELL